MLTDGRTHRQRKITVAFRNIVSGSKDLSLSLGTLSRNTGASVQFTSCMDLEFSREIFEESPVNFREKSVQVDPICSMREANKSFSQFTDRAWLILYHFSCFVSRRGHQFWRVTNLGDTKM